MCIYWLRRSGGRRLCSFTYCPFLDPFTTRLALPKTPQVQMSSLFDRYIPKAEASRFVRSDQLFTIDHVNHGCISASITQIALLFVLNRLPLTSSFSSPSSSLISSPPSPPLLFLLLFLLPFPPSLSSFPFLGSCYFSPPSIDWGNPISQIVGGATLAMHSIGASRSNEVWRLR